jgi:hypothetical protein
LKIGTFQMEKITKVKQVYSYQKLYEIDMEKEELKPKDLCLGNYIECFGKIEMVTGIVPREQGDWFITHSGNHALKSPLPEGVEFSGYGITLTEDWKKFLAIDKFDNLPSWIIYVHEAQNFLRWYAGVDTTENYQWKYFNSLTAL